MFELCLGDSTTKLITNAEDITEEFLTQSAGSYYTEHISHLKRVFNKIHVRTFLEFGVGFSTKYFIDHSEKAISVEIVTPGTGPEWVKYCINLYRNYKNWIPIVYFAGKYNGRDLENSWAPYKYMGADSVYQAAAYQPAHYQSYTLLDPSYLKDLDKFVKQQLASNEIDFAFVDSGVYIRGDLVQTLLNNQVPIIAAHDVSPNRKLIDKDVYGYNLIVVPENYIEIHVPLGMGTGFWIKKEAKYLEIIEDLQEYVKPKK